MLAKAQALAAAQNPTPDSFCTRQHRNFSARTITTGLHCGEYGAAPPGLSCANAAGDQPIIGARRAINISELCRHEQSWTLEACGDLWQGFEADDLTNGPGGPSHPRAKQLFSIAQWLSNSNTPIF